jgi:hypothetical protein
MMQVNVTLHVLFIKRSIPCNENHFPVVVLQVSHEHKYYEKSNFVYPAGIAVVNSMPQIKQPDGV